jgi:uncharacterized protein
MPTYSSPGNYVIEKDFSEYAPAVNSSIAGIVGFASKGPDNKATLITSPAQLIKVFGNPEDAKGGQGLLGAIEILSKTNSIYYVRVEDKTYSQTAKIPVSWGSCPAVEVSGIPLSTAVTFNFTSTDSAGVDNTPGTAPYAMTITTATSPGQDFIDGHSFYETADWPWTARIGQDASSVIFVNTHAGKDARLTVSSTVGTTAGTYDHTGNITAGAGAATATASGTTASGTSAGGTYFVESLYTGTGYNFSSTTTALGVINKGVKVVVDSKSGQTFNFEVFNEGVAAEGYTMNMLNNGIDPENVINIGTTNAVSDFIKASFLDSTGTNGNTWTLGTDWGAKASAFDAMNSNSGGIAAATPRFLKFLDGSYELAGGSNGDVSGGTYTSDIKAAIIGSASTKTGIYALDDDSLNISMACVPAVSEETIQNALITLAETSQNFLAVVSPPVSLSSPQQAINWHNGQYTGRTAAINSSYAAVYWPWLKTFDVNTASDIFMDPAAFAVAVMCHTDSVSDPWFAPAGLTRGRLTKPTDVEVILNQGDRDSLYQPGNAVNPIAKFAQDGIVIFGQRTAQRTPSSLDRVNVRRMMIVIRKMILQATRSIIFEPNDPLTWSRVVNLLQPSLDDIRRRRGITEFRVVCDETTNTPVRVDRNEMWCRVLIKPTKTAEVLIFELNLTNQSASLGV